MAEGLDRPTAPAFLSMSNGAQPEETHGLTPVVVLIVVGVGYYMAARLSLLLQDEAAGVAVFWPASGIAAGALIALGRTARWPTAAAIVLATLVANIERGQLPLISLVFGACNVLECLTLAASLSLLFKDRLEFNSLSKVMGFVGATIAATALAAVPAALALKHVAGVHAGLRDTWQIWFRSDALGIIAVAPLLISLPSALRDPLPPRRLLEVVGVLALLAVTSFYEFSHLPSESNGLGLLPLGLLFPLLLWLAARGTPLVAAAGAFTVAVSVVYCVSRGLGALGQVSQPLTDRVGVAQVAILTLSLCTLSLAALIAGLRETAAALHANAQRLKIATKAAKLGVFELQLQRDTPAWENERMYEIFGHSHADGVVSFADFRNVYLDPRQRDTIDRSFQSTLQTGEGHSICRIRRKDGVWRDLEIISVVEKGPDGCPERIVGVMADITERRQTEERQGLLMGELDHRVKNALETVLLLLEMTRRAALDVPAFADALGERLHAMARAHVLLGREHWSGVLLEAVVSGQLEPYAAPGRIGVAGPKVRLNSRATESLSMVLHELATNAAKYGALSANAGEVDVAWRRAGDNLEIDWRESGGPPVQQAGCRTGYGTKVITQSLTYELQGQVTLDLAPAGVRCRISVPVSRIEAT